MERSKERKNGLNDEDVKEMILCWILVGILY
jgi:hypothetical protein